MYLFPDIYFAQNLVLNPSFEDTIACPSSAGMANMAKYWISPTTGTSDYFNVCSSGTSVDIPLNYFGNQYARTGNGYCGFYCYDSFGTDYREYIEGELSSSLITNKKYCVEFYLSLSDSSRYAIKNIGFFFSPNLLTTSDYNHIPLTPHISSSSLGFITDTAGWVKVSGEFVAQGGESYITIGNFDDSVSTQFFDFNPTISFFNDGYYTSYYYIDDVKIYDCSIEIILPNVFTPNNDGINDYFIIQGINSDAQLQIYNRWGNVIYENNNYQNDWAGKDKNGNKLNDGVYYYMLQYNNETYKGFIQLTK